jgi:hypothetical protein
LDDDLSKEVEAYRAAHDAPSRIPIWFQWGLNKDLSNKSEFRIFEEERLRNFLLNLVIKYIASLVKTLTRLEISPPFHQIYLPTGIKYPISEIVQNFLLKNKVPYASDPSSYELLWWLPIRVRQFFLKNLQ